MSLNATFIAASYPSIAQDALNAPFTSSSAFSLVAVALALLVMHRVVKGSRTTLPLPPGPFPIPLVGNVHQLPTENAWELYAEWGEKYNSDVILFKVFSTPMVILNTHKAATDLLTKRWTKYSDRLDLPMANDLMGWRGTLAMSQFASKGHKILRRLISKGLNATAARDYFPLFERESTMFLRRVLEDPGKTISHTKTSSASLTLALNYGYHVTSDDDAVIKLASRALDALYVPGKYLVDFFPLLRFVPSWFPGAQFQRDAALWNNLRHDFHELPVELVKNNMENGTALPCYIRTVIEDAQDKGMETEQEKKESDYWIKMAGGSVFSGSVHPMMCVLQTFLLSMVLFPEAQAKAQEEIDRVIGSKRLPTLDDMDDLPYVDALIREVFRWGPPAPLGVAHATLTEDEYEGLRIPAGSVVIANIWKIMHDEKIFPDPFHFAPERYLPDAVTGILDPAVADMPGIKVGFGFGPRACPGVIIALHQVNIYIVRTLACFKVSNAIDDKGEKIIPEPSWCSHAVSHPNPFELQIAPRSKDHVDLIHHDSSQHLKGDTPWFMHPQKKD